MNLLAKSLDDFAPTSWYAVADTLVDGGASAPLPALVAAVRERAIEGDLRRADAWLGDGRGDLDAGAQLLTERIVDELRDRDVVQVDGDTIAFTDTYLGVHGLADGGVRLALPGRGWRTYDALPAPERRARHERDTARENTSAAIRHASQYRRQVRTPEQRSTPRQKTARMAAEELLASLRAFGYLPAFPVTVNAHGEVVEGNHRLAFAELARKALVAEREQFNGADPIAAADLDRRIASLERAEILRHAQRLDGSPGDALRVTVAAQIRIPWDAHEVKALAKRLSMDGLKVPAIAEMLGASERNVHRWTQETRAANAEVEQAAQIAEAQRLQGLGWSNRQIAGQLGVNDKTVGGWLERVRSDGAMAVTPQPRQPKVSDELLTAEAEAWVADSDGSMKRFAVHIRATHGPAADNRLEHALRTARQRAKAERDRMAVLGTPEPTPRPEPEPQDETEPTVQRCGTCGQVLP